MRFRVFIPTAGTGSRLGRMTRYINKSLVSVANRPAISHVIEQFPAEAEFVVALGHKGHLVREFLSLAYPGRTFLFGEVDPFEGPGSGLGLSLLSCREHLREPFVFIACDTLVREPIPAPADNWLGYADLPDMSTYRTLAVRAGRVEAVCEKGAGGPAPRKPYIGLAGIRDHHRFWEAMESGGNAAVAAGEAYGLRHLLGQGIVAHRFTWYDTGNPEALARAREVYREPGAPNILEKENEAIWFVGEEVVKFSDDEAFIANRVARARELRGYVPEVTGATAHMYRYHRAEGRVLSEVVTLPLFERLLAHAAGFWQPQTLNPAAQRDFRAACLSFYRDKTAARVDLFHRTLGKADGVETINGLEMPTLASLLGAVDWGVMCAGIPGRFHGDFHFENILYSERDQRFTFLDWRQEFGGSLTTGDVYYDLAKLLHGLIVCHEQIVAGHYWVEWKADAIRYDFHRKQTLVECERHFEAWLPAHGFARGKVRTLTALVYLNIAALHHHPYSLLLYALGKRLLFQELKGADGVH